MMEKTSPELNVDNLKAIRVVGRGTMGSVSESQTSPAKSRRSMAESWRMRMGQNNVPRRKSTEETSSDRMRRNTFFGLEASADSLGTLKLEDFHDVFGGPPRSISFRQSSCDLTPNVTRWSAASDSFYEKIFQSPESLSPAARSGKNLPRFKIPSGVGGLRRSDGFYDDIFESDDDRRLKSRSKSAKSKSKSNSSSVLSSEDLSPLRPTITFAEDVGFSSFTSKLRPINAPWRRSSSSVTPEEQHKRGTLASYMDFQFTETISDESFRSTHFGFSRQVPSPETISLEPISYQKTKMSVATVEDTDSPRSAISSLCKESEAKPMVQDKEMHDQEEDEVVSSYVIEITVDKMESTNGTVDEAIAWASEKFLIQSLEGLESGDQRNRNQYAETEGRRIKVDQRMDPVERMQFLTTLEGPKKWTMGEGKQ
ncbi:hypothetical protein NE237_001240 [Protea cynaroides]|uniref:Uncharacterized protein n=1 Tax=Protea cynaroides TaxID=273540 RepID=A0A9Q0KTR9_9MAGN|nr:hypothetical protein NE237_001240 [Protea cynaroides]